MVLDIENSAMPFEEMLLETGRKVRLRPMRPGASGANLCRAIGDHRLCKALLAGAAYRRETG